MIYPVHYLEIVLANVIGGYGYGGREGEWWGAVKKRKNIKAFDTSLPVKRKRLKET